MGGDGTGIAPEGHSAGREVTEAFHRAVNAHDIAAACALVAPDARIVGASGRVLDGDGFAQLLRATITAFPDLVMRVERWVIDGDLVVTEETMVGTHRGVFAGVAPTNRKVELPMCHVARVADGRIVERVSYHDTAGIIRRLQAGS